MTDHLSPVERVLQAVEDYKERQGGFRARCPAHRGVSDNSLSIKEGDDGRVLLTCFTGCDLQEIVNALGLDVVDLFTHDGRSGSPTGAAKKAGKKATKKPSTGDRILTTDELPT